MAYAAAIISRPGLLAQTAATRIPLWACGMAGRRGRVAQAVAIAQWLILRHRTRGQCGVELCEENLEKLMSETGVAVRRPAPSEQQQGCWQGGETGEAIYNVEGWRMLRACASGRRRCWIQPEPAVPCLPVCLPARLPVYHRLSVRVVGIWGVRYWDLGSGAVQFRSRILSFAGRAIRGVH
ncbi:hypothetical protein C8Q73DRAFT_167247 [Cubamyces lactineus]|nr:hypothetical protein C8Q73DRAFT_167247 [Cubamyces lactineus]